MIALLRATGQKCGLPMALAEPGATAEAWIVQNGYIGVLIQ